MGTLEFGERTSLLNKHKARRGARLMGPEVVVSADVLKEYVARIHAAAGVPPATAYLIADSLVAANLRGVDSHGSQLTVFYIERILAGDMDPHAEGCIVSEQGATMLYDGRNGIGQRISEICCGHAIRIAREYGAAMVSVRESNHFGAAAYWAEKMADAGQLGLVFCNASTIVPPWQGREARLGTNPICMAVPGPWLLDMATTTVAMNRIYKAQMDGYKEIPRGWAVDANGVETTDPNAAVNGMPMPLGGYKGSGLGMMVEILCSVLSGGAHREEVAGIHVRGRKSRASQMFMAIDVARFLPVTDFAERLEHLIGYVKSSRPAPGYDEVLVAGDPEWRMEAMRLREGIPLGQGTWSKLADVAKRLGVTVPEVPLRTGA
jgi:LDH2 family malate/lactate/ureidoglycolate dehydrogenase